MRRLLSLVITLTMIVSTVTAGVTPVYAAQYSGQCGDNLIWSLDDETGLLEISGDGGMWDWDDQSDVPWHDYRSYITTVIIGEGVTSIGSMAFYECAGMLDIYIPDGVTSIGEMAFEGCVSLPEIPTARETSSAISVTGAALDTDSLELTVGDYGNLFVTFYPENATDKTAFWSSSAPDVADVDENGTVHAISEGTAVITVASADGSVTVSCVVTVKTDTANIIITVTPQDASARQGDTVQFYANIDGVQEQEQDNGTFDIAWGVSNNLSPDTIISEQGLLTIALDETAETLVVTAALVDDASKFGLAVVDILAEPNSDEDITDKFTDLRFLAAIRELTGKSFDEPIYASDVEGIVYLDVSSRDIESLDGIEYFKSITTLLCNDNRLTGLDVSENILLTWLNCMDNYMDGLDDVIGWETIPALVPDETLLFRQPHSQSGSLANPVDITDKFIDPNFLAAVRERLGKGSAEPIYDTDVENVTYLDVNSRNISSLNGMEYFKGLQVLYCYNNQLTELDVSNNTALTSLYCQNNQLTELVVSNNTVLTHLDCGYNQLAELDISSSTALTNLYCWNNQLTSLDVSNNLQLEGLYCRYNYMDAPDDVIGWETIPGLVLGDAFLFYPQYSKPVVSVDITDKFTDPNFLAAAREMLGKGSADSIYDTDVENITYLDVNSRNISSLNGIEYFKGLQVLYCYNNQLTELDVSNNTALTSLDCYNNQLTSLDVSSNKALSSLYCYNNQLTSLDVSSNEALSSLSCLNNQLTSLDVSNNTALTSLYCYNNQLTSLDVSSNMQLEWLYCSSNQLTSLDVSNNMQLKWLWCSSNQLTSLDVSNNLLLEWLNCSYNYMDTPDDVIGWETIPGLALGDTLETLGARQSEKDGSVRMTVILHDIADKIITEHGFVYSVVNALPTLDTADCHVARIIGHPQMLNQTGDSALLDTPFTPIGHFGNQILYVRAYVVSEGFVSYGDVAEV